MSLPQMKNTKTRAGAAEAETIRGAIVRARFHNPSNGYSVLQVAAGDDFITAVGYVPSVREGDEFSFSGRYANHPKFGRQFIFDQCELLLPKTKKGIVAYLASLTYGVGNVKAGRIVDTLGEDCLELIRESPEELRRVPGITPEQADEISARLGENAVLAELSSLICRQGVTPRLAAAVYLKYGPESVDIVKNNPYVLADDIYRVGFITADRIAQAVGVATDSPYRVRAALEFVLKNAAEMEGHCYLRPRDIAPAVKKVLKGCGISTEHMAAANEELNRTGKTIREKSCVYLARMHAAEVRLAGRMRRLLEQEIEPNAGLEQAVSVAEKVAGMEYADRQKDAIRTVLQNPLSIITGGPGTGKSTVTNGILIAYQKLFPENKIYLASPTGRAAKRLAEVTGQEAKTIHRLLRYHPEMGFQVNEGEPLAGPGLLIVDEISMADMELAADLFAGIPDNLQVVLIGDADQLPSVGPGSVLRDAILSGAVPTVCLEYNYRQEQGSRIAEYADLVRRGEMPPLASRDGDVECVSLDGYDAPVEQVVPAVLARVRQALDDGLTPMEFQILAPMRRGPAGVTALNAAIQGMVNPATPDKAEISRGKECFRVGDKVMVIKNDYQKGVFNGDMGIVAGAENKGPDGPGLRVRIDGCEVFFSTEDLGLLALAYASTIHKAQGNEFPLAIVVCVRSHYIMLQRNLLYTAITRAKHRLILVCQESAVKAAVKNDKIKERYSRLKERLVEPDATN